MRLLISSLVLITLFSCATPVAPTGGEPDRSGPQLVSTQPENGTVNYRERVVRFTFEDYVDRNSFRQALQIEPNISVPFEISWRRRTATINLLQPLPDNATVVFTIGTQLRDTRGNALKSPIMLGMSTGPELDKGEATVKLRPLRPGVNVDNVRILMYRAPFDFSKPALYVAEPDTSGLARFRYLAEGEYAVMAVHDVNRNRIWDSAREYGQPASQERFLLGSEVLDMGTIYYARRDTTRTTIEGVGLLSSQRIRLRFSQEIPYNETAQIKILHAETGDFQTARMLFVDPNDTNVAIFHTRQPLSEEELYTIEPDGLRDRNGRTLRSAIDSFDGSSQSDTTFIRFKRHLTQDGVRSREPFRLQYSGVIEGSPIADSLQIFRNRTRETGDVRIQSSYNILSIYPSSEWNESDSFEIRAWDPAQQRHIDITTRFIRETDMGGIQINVADSSMHERSLIAELYDRSGKLLSTTEFQQRTLIENLPADSYHVIVFEDRERTGIWFTGTIYPFSPPAPVSVQRSVSVRSRMTSELDIEFNW